MPDPFIRDTTGESGNVVPQHSSFLLGLKSLSFLMAGMTYMLDSGVSWGVLARALFL